MLCVVGRTHFISILVQEKEKKRGEVGFCLIFVEWFVQLGVLVLRGRCFVCIMLALLS